MVSWCAGVILRHRDGERIGVLTGRSRGFTLIEILAVIAIIMIVMALAVPNFFEMLRARRWHAAAGALQNALLRCQSYAINERRDHSVEICWDTDNEAQYFRIEVESALLESISELNSYYRDQCQYYYMRLPVDWLGAFVAGGGDVVNYPAHPWGAYPDTRFNYTGPKYDVDAGDWRIDERIKDNLLVDDENRLPFGVDVDEAASDNLMNFDAPPQNENVLPYYGWDETVDLRFGRTGTLVQTRNPEVVLRNRDGEKRRFQVLRNTGRVRALRTVGD